jgi:CubicO group peptidase (beta-lactamase class C family)
VPNIDPALGSPQVLDGFDASGAPKLRPAKRPITLRHLLTHTAGFSYDIWDAITGRYIKASGMPARSTAKVASIRTPLIFDPGDRWEYGVNTDWVGRLVEATSGQPLDAYFRDKIFAPLGMKDSGYVTSTEQRARQARLHVRQGDGSLQPQPLEAVAVAGEFWSGGGPLYSTGRDCFSTRAPFQLPHRQHPGRHHEDADARPVQRRRSLPRGPDPLGPRLHAEPPARAERPERGHRELGRDLQHLLLARPREARHRAHHDADPAVRGLTGAQALRAVRERDIRGVAFRLI